jgi:hypothetical protein
MAATKKKPAFPSKQCDNCKWYSHAATAVCDHCQTPFPPREPKAPRTPKVKRQTDVNLSNDLSRTLAFAKAVGGLKNAMELLITAGELTDTFAELAAMEKPKDEETTETDEEAKPDEKTDEEAK